MQHDWQPKIQCTLCLGVQTPENRDDDRCSGGIRANLKAPGGPWERVQGIVRRDDGALPKEALVHGKYYYGRCRNASIARWDGVRQIFVHWRHKFGSTFLEDIHCREDELHFDVFDPFYELEDDWAINTIKISDLPETATS